MKRDTLLVVAANVAAAATQLVVLALFARRYAIEEVCAYSSSLALLAPLLALTTIGARLAHLRSRLAEGIYREEGVTLHVSPGLGTTFVPFRFFARPEATELVLRPA